MEHNRFFKQKNEMALQQKRLPSGSLVAQKEWC